MKKCLAEESEGRSSSLRVSAAQLVMRRTRGSQQEVFRLLPLLLFFRGSCNDSRRLVMRLARNNVDRDTARGEEVMKKVVTTRRHRTETGSRESEDRWRSEEGMERGNCGLES